jgi:thioredoxin family protein
MPQPEINLPELPESIAWINIRVLPTRTLIGRTVPLVWFWDYCSLNALRALPYLQEWHRRYAAHGLRVIGVHSPEFDFGADRSLVENAVRRLAIEFPVAPDPKFEVWRLYGNEVWPALYLWDRRGVLRHHHFAEGGYEQTERVIQELLREIDEELELPQPMAPLRKTDHPGALVKAPTPHRYLGDDRSGREVAAGEELSVRYQGATAAAVLSGRGTAELDVDGELRRIIRLDGPRLYKLVDSGRHEEHELTLRFRDAARAYVFSFAAGPA